MNKSFQDLKMKEELIKKIQTEGMLKMKYLGIHTRSTEASLTNRITRDGRNSFRFEDKTEVVDAPDK